MAVAAPNIIPTSSAGTPFEFNERRQEWRGDPECRIQKSEEQYKWSDAREEGPHRFALRVRRIDERQGRAAFAITEAQSGASWLTRWALRNRRQCAAFS